MLLSTLCACSTLMRSDDGAIDEVATPVEVPLEVGISLEMVEQPEPEAVSGPTGGADINAIPLAVAFREITPGSAGGEDPEDAVEHSAVVVVSPSSSAL